MTTYAGPLLRIDLSLGTAQSEDIPDALKEKFISARGLGVQYLYEKLTPSLDPLSPENKLYMGIGVLGGTGLQGFSKWAIMFKSPLTGTIFRAVTGGNFGAWMKHAGYDAIIVEGRADKPSYLHIDEQGVHFRGAADLLGLSPRHVQRKLKERHGSRTESACIGVAGEKCVRYAVVSSGERTASRGGVGTVMGSKNLKAISINVPSRKQAPFNKVEFDRLVKKQIAILKEHPRRKNMSALGTPAITRIVNSMGILPVRNFQEGSVQSIEAISENVFYKIKRGRAGCYQCMTRCGGMRDVTRGPLRGSQIDGPEYETIYALGPLLGVLDPSFIIDANALCDDYGLDTISTGVCIAFACELFEKGILSRSDADGFDLTWGNKEALFSLIGKIGRREGLGLVLGEGVMRAAAQISEHAGDYAMHIKGLEIPGYEPRAIKGYALSMATSNIGGSHMYGRPRKELSGLVDPSSEEGKGAAVARVQIEQALEDSLIACTFGNAGLDLQTYSELLTAATGIEAFGDRGRLLEIGERIVCMERCFNVREGFRRKDDALPKRMTLEPLKNAGPATGQRVRNLDQLLDEYYEALGYTKEGVPTIEKLHELEMEETVKDVGSALP